MIEDLHHVSIAVPDLEVGKAFYQRFGLTSQASGDRLIFRCEDRAQDQIILTQGPNKRLTYVSFRTNAKSLADLAAKLDGCGIKQEKVPQGQSSTGIWFRDTVGDLVNVRAGSAVESAGSLPHDCNGPGRTRRINVRGVSLDAKVKRAKPRRLGHLIKFTPDVRRSLTFYTEVLGFKVTDRAGDEIAFLCSPFGGDHHILGLAKSTHSGLHHLSFEVGSIEEIEIGAQYVVSGGYKSVFGLGRHVAGSNYFHYFRDPWNSMVEYFWDMDVIGADDTSWTAYDVPPPDLTASWSTQEMPHDFIHNFESYI